MAYHRGSSLVAQQIAALQVLVAEELLLAVVHKSGAVDATRLAVTGADRLLHGAVLGVGVTRRATEGVAQLGNEVRVAIHRQGVRLRFAIGVEAEGTDALRKALFRISCFSGQNKVE